MSRNNIFQHGLFQLSNGEISYWKIECDALTNKDWETFALLIAQYCSFSEVVGVPRGGIPLAKELNKYAIPNSNLPILIVDDVLTTGSSMENYRDQIDTTRDIIGYVVFARDVPPKWINVLFQFNRGL